jgi:hypothetical protein
LNEGEEDEKQVGGEGTYWMKTKEGWIEVALNFESYFPPKIKPRKILITKVIVESFSFAGFSKEEHMP